MKRPVEILEEMIASGELKEFLEEWKDIDADIQARERWSELMNRDWEVIPKRLGQREFDELAHLFAGYAEININGGPSIQKSVYNYTRWFYSALLDQCKAREQRFWLERLQKARDADALKAEMAVLEEREKLLVAK